MSLTIQKGFWNDTVIANTRQKLAELYFNNPEIVESEKRVILEYWQTYDGLAEVLEDKLPAFVCWFHKATSHETISRCLRSLKEDGTIKLNHEDTETRKKNQQEWRHYWGNEKRVSENGRDGHDQELF